MRKLEGTLVLMVLCAGCAAEKQEVESAADADTVDGCKDLGGRVVVDPGDGSAACAPGEEIIGHPRGFIEGATCCRPVPFVPTRQRP